MYCLELGLSYDRSASSRIALLSGCSTRCFLVLDSDLSFATWLLRCLLLIHSFLCKLLDRFQSPDGHSSLRLSYFWHLTQLLCRWGTTWNWEWSETDNLLENLSFITLFLIKSFKRITCVTLIYIFTLSNLMHWYLFKDYPDPSFGLEVICYRVDSSGQHRLLSVS